MKNENEKCIFAAKDEDGETAVFSTNGKSTRRLSMRPIKIDSSLVPLIIECFGKEIKELEILDTRPLSINLPKENKS